MSITGLSENASTESECVWAFDLGKGSIGEAVRRGNTFLHKSSLLIPATFAETKSAANRRRMWRTRQAHKAREQWLKKVMGESGIEILHGRNYDSSGNWKPGEPGDRRLEQEFPDLSDDTCYTSCLLRIKLMRGEKLEPWQVFKAFHSAIQRRGYDKDIPWKTREVRNKVTDDQGEDAGTEKRMHDFERELEKMAPGKPQFQFPAYFEACQMGLWDLTNPDILKLRIDFNAKTTRNQIMPRALVESEIRAMVAGAAKHYPALAGKADYLLYGPSQLPYASMQPELRNKFNLREGSDADWQGVVGQKIPRFDNRIIAKCALIPRLNVCKIREGDKGKPHPGSLLAVEVAFLMKLKNIRLQRSGGVSGLSAPEIRAIFQDPKRKDWQLTKTAWKRYCAALGAIPLPGHELVEAPRLSGRSRFCRPALDILKRLILEGKPPSEFLREELGRLKGNKNPLKGLVEQDLKFLADLVARNDTWEGIYIPNQQLDSIVQESDHPDEAIGRLIGQQNDPIVRHRLTVFYHRLCELEKITKTQPDKVVLEFVREDFMGKKARLEYRSFIKKRAEERSKAREEAAAVGATEKSAGLKLELLRAQDGRCLYTDEGLIPSKLDEYQIEHIVPRAKGGPDAVLNYVLTTTQTNIAKADRTPYDWFHQDTPDKWDAYVNRVRARASHLHNKKVQLLISPQAAELAEKYTALAETAWIAKLAKAIVGLRFGWRNGVDEDGKLRVSVISGGLTGRIRRKYALNQILNPSAKTEEEAETKNRNDDRHHALDAMVISFVPQWARDVSKTHFFRFPESVHKNPRGFFEKEIASVIPQSLCFEKVALAETIYGCRTDGGKQIIIQRVEVSQLAYRTVQQRQIFDLDYLVNQIKAVRDQRVQLMLAEFHAKTPDEASWKRFCEDFRLIKKDGSPGQRIVKVSMSVGEPTEYKDLSKDGSGAYRRALKGHKGQIVYLVTHQGENGVLKNTLHVRPVYAFESQAVVVRELTEKLGGNLRIVGFFQSGCLIQVDTPVVHAKQTLPPGTYRLNTIRTGSKDVKITTANGKTHPEIPRYSLGAMIAAGFRRIDLL